MICPPLIHTCDSHSLFPFRSNTLLGFIVVLRANDVKGE